MAEPASPGIDPKGAAGAIKTPMMVLPWAVVLELTVAMGEGATKYGPHNWRHSGGVVASTYLAAAMRHLIAYTLGEDIDPDSVAEDGSGGVSHIVKAMAGLAVLRDAQIHGAAVDDRPPASPTGLPAEIAAMWRGVAAAAREHVTPADTRESHEQ